MENIKSIKEIDFTFEKYILLLDLYSNIDEKIKLNYERFNLILSNIKSNLNHNIFIYLDSSSNILGAITLLLEQKFIHDGKYVGHIEDFVVKKEYRAINIGSQLLNHAINVSKENNCYKVILDCDERLVNYYGKYGFINKGKYMGLYFL